MEKRTDNNDNIGASFPEDIEINTAERSYGPIGDEAAPGSERTPGIVDGTTGSFHRVGTQDLSEDTPEKTPWYKKPFIRKIGYALIALFIALTLWGYVLMSENPVRIKRVNNVSLSFESGSEADLKSRGLIISGDIGSILPEIAVNVRTTLNDLPRFNASMDDIVTATISLNDIREPGTYVRKIVATSSIGTVESVEPSTVTITVEDLVSRMIPVKCSFTNSLPDGYWRDEPELATSSITISGAESAISRRDLPEASPSASRTCVIQKPASLASHAGFAVARPLLSAHQARTRDLPGIGAAETMLADDCRMAEGMLLGRSETKCMEWKRPPELRR